MRPVALPSMSQVEAARQHLRDNPPPPLTDGQVLTIRAALKQR